MNDLHTPEFKELSCEEMTAVDGGFRNLIAVPKFLYLDETPSWAVANARAVGYEVENIS